MSRTSATTVLCGQIRLKQTTNTQLNLMRSFLSLPWVRPNEKFILVPQAPVFHGRLPLIFPDESAVIIPPAPPPPPKKKTRMKELLWEWSLANAVWVLLSCWDCPKFSPRAGTEIKKPFKLTRKLSPSAFNRIALKKPQQLTLSFQNET